MLPLNQTMLNALADTIREKNIELKEEGKIVTIEVYTLQGEYEGYFRCLMADFNKAYLQVTNPEL